METGIKGCCRFGRCGDGAWVREGLPQPHAHPLPPRLSCAASAFTFTSPAPPTASAPPAAPNPHVASFPPDAQPVSAQLPFSGPKPAADAPLADPPRCTSPTGGHPPLQRAAATAASPAGSSAASVDVPSTDLDARAPVQEKVSGTGLRRSLLERGFSGLGATSTLSLPVCSVLAAPGGFAHGEAGGQAPSVPFPRAIWGRMQLLLVSSSELPPFSLHAAL